MPAFLVIAALGALGAANSVALFVQNSRCKKDAAATDAALRLAEANLRKEIVEAKLAAAESRTGEFTVAVSEALRNAVVAIRPATQGEIKADRTNR